MTRSTLALAYAAKVAPAAARPVLVVPAEPAPASRPAPAGARPQPPLGEDALLIAVRRSLASCRDTSHRRMLAAFESTR